MLHPDLPNEYQVVYPYNLEALIALDVSDFTVALEECVQDMTYDPATAPRDDLLDLGNPDIVTYTEAVSVLITGMKGHETLDTGYRAYVFGHIVAALVTSIPPAIPDVSSIEKNNNFGRLRSVLARRALSYLSASPHIRNAIKQHLPAIDPTGMHTELAILMAGAALYDIDDMLEEKAHSDAAEAICEWLVCREAVPVLN